MNRLSSLIEQIKQRSPLELIGTALTLLLLLFGTVYFVSFIFFPTGEETDVPSAAISIKSDPILAACPASAHAKAFRKGHKPDLAHLGINLCYELELELNEDGNAFDAVARMTIRNGHNNPWPHLLFRLYPHSRLIFGGDIKIEETMVDGVQVPTTRILPDRTGLYVPLSHPLAAGESVQVTITFRGLLHEYGKNKQAYGLFSYTPSTVTLASWYPMLAVWDDEQQRWSDALPQDVGDAVFADNGYVQAKITSPERFALAASGVIWDEQQSDGRNTYIIVAGPARDLALVWLEGYQVATAEVAEDGPIIRSWYHSSGAEPAAYTALNTAQEALSVFEHSFGPYPFKELDLVAVPLWNWGGMEYPQLMLLADDYYQPNSPTQAELAPLVAHETAHQWWYSAVGSDVHSTPWQDEALAEWSSLLWLEKIHGTEAAQYRQAQLAQMVEELQNIKGNPPLAQSTEQLRGDNNIYYALIYGKGALFLSQLRQEIGDDAFFAALRDYYNNNRFDIANAVDLLTTFEEQSQRSLDGFYDEWGVKKR